MLSTTNSQPGLRQARGSCSSVEVSNGAYLQSLCASIIGTTPSNRSGSHLEEKPLKMLRPVQSQSSAIPGHQAGRLLGPTEITGNGSHGNKPCASSVRRIEKKSTSRTNTILLEIECDPIEEYLTDPNNGWCTRGSSPLLGRFGNDCYSMDSRTNSHTQLSTSSSALNNYHGFSASPLSVSQQTSASSALYMALRKSSPPTKSPLCDDEAGPRKTSEEKVGEPLTKNRRRRMQKPPHLDLSALFSKPRTSNGPLFSPQEIVSSPSVLSLASGSIHSTSSSPPKLLRWRSNKSKGSSSHTNMTSPQSPIFPMHTPLRSDTCLVSRELPGRLGDAKGGEHSENADMSESPKKSLKGGSGSPYVSNSGDSQFSPPIRTSTSKIGDALMIGYDTQFSKTATLSIPNRAFVRQSQRNRRYVSNSSRIADVDLHTQSFLALSSSEDEIESDSRPMKKGRRPPQNIDGPWGVGDDIRGCSKALTPPRQSFDVLRHITARSSSLSHKTIKRAQEHSSKSSNKIHQSCLGQSARPKRVVLVDSSTLDISPRESSSCVTAKAKKETFIPIPMELRLQTDKVMAVTREEENLLNAMRKKRATMRQAAFAEGYNNAVEQKALGCRLRDRKLQVHKHVSPCSSR